MIQFRILGPLDVIVDGRSRTPGSPRQRAVLAVLLINANRTTSIDQLLGALWSDAAPDTAVGQIHTLVWRLRRLLGQAIVTRPGGYQLVVPPGASDAELFGARAAAGAELARSGQLGLAAERFSMALALWRGGALCDVRLPGDARACGLQAAVAELTERRLAVERDHIDVELRRGRHAELVPMLQHRVDAEPLREDLRERLMLALHRGGRRAEALEVYRRGREVLVAELGLEPGGGLRRLHAQILAGDPGLDGAGGHRPGGCQLPVDLADFVAREELVAELAAVLTAAGGTPPTVAISGVAGCGKTALAVHVAHLVRHRYPDGQLFVDLRGVDEPLPSGEVLARFLRALGEDGRALPADPDERAALFRARTTGRRVLVVLDNAGCEAHVRPLLPADPGCALLVTSRRRLVTLPAAHQVDVAVFTPAEALTLLERTAGVQRVVVEPAACAVVVDRCGYLPLAIRIAGARLAARPHRPVARLADQLADERARLDVLRTGDLAVRSSLAAGYRTLAEPERRAFELVGALRVPDCAAWLAASLLDVPMAQAEEHLERLVEARLVEAGRRGDGPVRYRLHDLVGAYARELAGRRPDVDAALGRAFGASLALAERANDRLPGGFRRGGIGDAPRCTGWTEAEAGELLADPVAWFEAERAALVAVVRQAAGAGRDESAWELACALGRFFELREHHDDWRATHEAALRACRAAGNDRGEAYLLRALGEMYLDVDRLDEALSCFAPALSIMAALGDRLGQALVLRGQGTAYRLLSRDREAMESLDRALLVCDELDDRAGKAQVLHNMGVLHRHAGRADAAEACYRRALALFGGLGDRFGLAYVLCSLGIVLGGHADADAVTAAAAERHLADSVGLCRELGYRRGEALALGHLGELHLRRGEHRRAVGELRLAVAGCREVDDGPGEVIALRRLGQAYLAAGNLAAARSALQQCLALGRTFEPAPERVLPRERAMALSCLGEIDARERAR